MKSFILGLFAILFLFTSCNQEKKENTSKADTQNSDVEMVKNNSSLIDTKWKLITFKGKDVSDKNAFLIFSTKNKKVYGYGSCNNFSGTYKLDAEHSNISISKLATTLKACQDSSLEAAFLAFLETTDNYSIKGTKMVLNKSKMAPFAVFEISE